MSWLDDLANSIRNTAGKAVYYGTQNNLPELNISENLNKLGNWIAPKAQAATFVKPNYEIKPTDKVYYGPDRSDFNPISQPTPTGGNGNGGDGGDGRSTDDAQYQQLLRELSDRFGELTGAYDSGMNYFNSARDALGRKREEFNTDFTNKNQDIFEGFQSGRGYLQGASRGMDSSTVNSLASRGASGGSLQDALIARNQQSRYNKLGDLVNNRATNDRGNEAVLNQNKNWALGQEGEINRGQADLQRTRQEGENALRSQSLSTLGNLASQAQAQRAALAASMGKINTANLEQYAPSLLGKDVLTNINASLMGGQSGQDPNANININPNLSLLDQERLRRQQLGFA